MGIGTATNPWWRDVLENGPRARSARFFDVDWNPVKRELKRKLLLPILAPLIDLFALYGLLFENPARTLAFWCAFNAIQLAIAGYGFRLDGESLKPLWAMPLQQFVYRQLMYLVIIESTISALIGVRAHWQHIPRTGDVEIATVDSGRAV